MARTNRTKIDHWKRHGNTDGACQLCTEARVALLLIPTPTKKRVVVRSVRVRGVFVGGKSVPAVRLPAVVFTENDATQSSWRDRTATDRSLLRTKDDTRDSLLRTGIARLSTGEANHDDGAFDTAMLVVCEAANANPTLARAFRFLALALDEDTNAILDRAGTED